MQPTAHISGGVQETQRVEKALGASPTQENLAKLSDKLTAIYTDTILEKGIPQATTELLDRKNFLEPLTDEQMSSIFPARVKYEENHWKVSFKTPAGTLGHDDSYEVESKRMGLGYRVIQVDDVFKNMFAVAKNVATAGEQASPATIEKTFPVGVAKNAEWVSYSCKDLTTLLAFVSEHVVPGMQIDPKDITELKRSTGGRQLAGEPAQIPIKYFQSGD